MNALQKNNAAFDTPQGQAFLARYPSSEEKKFRANPWLNMFLWAQVGSYLRPTTSDANRSQGGDAGVSEEKKETDLSLESDGESDGGGCCDLFGDDDDW